MRRNVQKCQIEFPTVSDEAETPPADVLRGLRASADRSSARKRDHSSHRRLGGSDG